jgi:hypothetical protein
MNKGELTKALQVFLKAVQIAEDSRSEAKIPPEKIPASTWI